MARPTSLHDAILDILDEKRDSLVPAREIAEELGVDIAVVELPDGTQVARTEHGKV